MVTSVLNDAGLALLLVSLCCIALIVRRSLLRRGGAVLDLCVRTRGTHSHWVFGLARYTGDTLEWFRILGFAARPSRTFRRDQIAVVSRRVPSRGEAASFVHGAVVLECVDGRRRLDLALPATAMNGFQAWLEALPPGTAAVARPESPDGTIDAQASAG
ncbi:MAG: hypothetical protein JWM93_3800 [Frankiales bacterium]|nr:hypothetical protein [Frankiales bacterium]